MKKLITLLLVISGLSSQAQNYMGTETEIRFFSTTPIEDIEAKNSLAQVVLRISDGRIIVKPRIKDFKFKSALMEEHFNENFMESEKFPFATFDGKINESVDYSKDGEYNVTASGTMEIHGVKQSVNISGTLMIKAGKIYLNAKFPIKLADYKIEDPSVIGKKVAEVVEVSIKSTLVPSKK